MCMCTLAIGNWESGVGEMVCWDGAVKPNERSPICAGSKSASSKQQAAYQSEGSNTRARGDLTTLFPSSIMNGAVVVYVTFLLCSFDHTQFNHQHPKDVLLLMRIVGSKQQAAGSSKHTPCWL